jgi:hypothetical protein
MSGFLFDIRWMLPSFWWQQFWWNVVPGEIITIPWPGVSTIPIPDAEWSNWLCDNVGTKGWDWDWRFSQDDANFGAINWGMIDIKFRKGKTSYAMLAAIKWAK